MSGLIRTLLVCLSFTGPATLPSSLITFCDAAEMEVSAGEPAEVVWTVPVSASVGEPFTAKLAVKDRYGNVVTDVDQRGIAFEIGVLGHGDIWPKTIMPKSFVRGVAEIQMIYKVAERIELRAQAAGQLGERLQGRSAPFHVQPGKLAEIRLVSPASARAGIPFRVTLVALDAFGNQIKDFNRRSDGVALSAPGPIALNPARVTAESFVDGIAEVSVIYTGTGDLEIRAKDLKSGLVGRMGGKIKVGAGTPDRFQITAPATAAVDEAFDVAITAMDAYGNVVLDYDAVGTLVFLQSDGSVALSPSELSAKHFSQGVAFAKILYGRPEHITLIATEPGTTRAGSSGRIDVRPGRARLLEVAVPESAEAGVPFTVKVRALDSKGNPTSAPQGKITLAVVGTVSTAPLEIPASAFQNGGVERKATYNVAEEIIITAQDAAGGLRSEPARLQVRPGRVASIDVSAPSTVSAGAGITASLVALDAYRNVVTDPDRMVTATSVLVRVVGPEASPMMDVPLESFTQGRASVTLNYFRAGAVRVSAELPSGRGEKMSRTISNAVEVLPGATHHFELGTSAQANAGTPFRLMITARDAYGNTVGDYNRTGGGVNIHSSGIGEVQPNQVSSSSFIKGVAQVELRSYAAERLVLTASERFGTATGRSGQIKIIPGPLSHFMVSVAPKVRAGEPFPIRVEAQDLYYNLIREFTFPGKIRLKTSGQGKIIPAEISAADFAEGVASMSATLTTAGMQELSVETDDRAAQGRSNPIQVLPSSAVSFKVDVLDAVTAGEPFRARVTAQDAYGNPVEDVRSIGRPVQLAVGQPGTPSSEIVPSSFSPHLFTRGVAEGYLVYPQAGRVSIQVKGRPAGMFKEFDAPVWKPQVEGLFFKTSRDRTEIFVLATGPLEYRASQPTSLGGNSNALVIGIPGAVVVKTYDYDALDLPGLKAAKLIGDGESAGRIVLKLDASYGYTIQSRANMIHVVLRPGAAAAAPTLTLPGVDRMGATIPSLASIQSMVDAGSYRDARKAVELFLAAHPAHPEAVALRARLEKVLKVLGQ